MMHHFMKGADVSTQKMRVECDLGLIWFIGWLFTIGYLKLTFWTAVLGLIIWPYYLGAGLR